MKQCTILITLVVCLAVSCFIAGAAQSTGGRAAFGKTTIDIGVVVSNVEKAAQFYTEAVGFTEVRGFEVSAPLTGDSGLTDYKALKVRVFVLAEEATATRLKLMEIPETEPKRVDNQYINSSLGFSYLTVHTADTAAAVERAKKAGVQPVKKPYPLGGNNYLTLLKDPDGNIVELVGP